MPGMIVTVLWAATMSVNAPPSRSETPAEPLERDTRVPDTPGPTISKRDQTPLKNRLPVTPDAAVDVDLPFGGEVNAREPSPPVGNSTLMARLDLLAGPTWRTRQVDAMLTTSLEFGKRQGFSGSFHTSMIAGTTPDEFLSPLGTVRSFDFPIGVGAVARGRLRKVALYGSVGVTAGILVHRAAHLGQVTRRVDPDFRVPIRVAWTIADVGVSVSIIQGYSVRNRAYERRGAELWRRHAYRVGFAVGLHYDLMVAKARVRRSKRKQGG